MQRKCTKSLLSFEIMSGLLPTPGTVPPPLTPVRKPTQTPPVTGRTASKAILITTTGPNKIDYDHCPSTWQREVSLTSTRFRQQAVNWHVRS